MFFQNHPTIVSQRTYVMFLNTSTKLSTFGTGVVHVLPRKFAGILLSDPTMCRKNESDPLLCLVSLFP